MKLFSKNCHFLLQQKWKFLYHHSSQSSILLEIGIQNTIVWEKFEGLPCPAVCIYCSFTPYTGKWIKDFLEAVYLWHVTELPNFSQIINGKFRPFEKLFRFSSRNHAIGIRLQAEKLCCIIIDLFTSHAPNRPFTST